MYNANVILEAQLACTPTPRGIHCYTIQLLRSLLKRNKFQYGLAFFDENRERNNKQWIDKYFGEYNVPIHECNNLNYRAVMDSLDAFERKSYNDYTQTFGDVYHFFNIFFPDNLKGQSVVTVHDLTPVVMSEYCAPSWTKSSLIGVERLKRAQPTIITVSQHSKSDIVHYTGIPEGKIHVISSSYDEESLLEGYGSEALSELSVKSPYLLYLGRINVHKNIVRITEAFEMLAQKHPDVNLVIAGFCDPDYSHSEPIVKRVKESPYFGSRIIMPGYVSNEQKNALYSNALAFVFPSIYEGFGLPVLEAMVRGCPVITSNTSSLPEVAGDAAILIDPYDTEQLAHEMERIITSDSLRESLKQKGFARAKMFSWDKTAEMTENVYKSALNCN